MVKTEKIPCFYINQSETRAGTDVMLLGNTFDRPVPRAQLLLDVHERFLVSSSEKQKVDAGDVKRTNFQPRSQGEGKPWKRG